MFVWLALIPVIEAAEQTVLQRSIPYERQGRVFGFAQLVENAAAPVTAFLIGPFAETIVMPSMTDGSGADAIGDWFGTGPDRGLALMFTLAGLIGDRRHAPGVGQPLVPRTSARSWRAQRCQCRPRPPAEPPAQRLSARRRSISAPMTRHSVAGWS